MATITEDYCDFETAKLLKEKGFDEGCSFVVNAISKNVMPVSWPTTNSDIEDEETSLIALPTLQMAMKWLREEKGIAAVPILSSVLDNEKFLWDIEITVAKTNETYHQGWIYESYERVCEAAIKYCLENLI